MLKRKKSITTLMLTALVTASLSGLLSSAVHAASSRLWGQDRYETSVEISKQGWTTSDYVVVASGEGYADALCAAPLAKKYNAPILLTEGSALNAKTKEEIKRLNAKHVLIIGKYASVSKAAEDELLALVGDVKRLGGDNRYETSVVVAKELGTIDKVAVTSGNGFADALAMAPIAAQESMPILLTGKEELPQVVADYIKDNKDAIKESYVVGGTGVISDTAASQVSTEAVRLSGQNRYETNVNIMTHFHDKVSFDNLYVVQGDGPTGKEFADALSGAALAAKTSAPIILTYKAMPDVTENFIKLNLKPTTNITALGGVAAVPDTIVTKLEDNITQIVNLEKELNKQLGNIKDTLNTITPQLATDNEKNMAGKIISFVDKALADSSYDPTKDMDEVRSLYSNLTEEEKADFMTKISSNLPLEDLLKLLDNFQ